MKLGNISQTIVPVPNFFVDQKNRTIEAFDIYPKTTSHFSGIKKILKLNLNEISSKSQNSSLEKNRENNKTSCRTSRILQKFSFKKKSNYYRDKDLLTTFYNLNINKNPRNFTRQWIQMNQEKYIPLYYRNNYNNDLKETNKTYFPEIIDLNKPKSVNKKKTVGKRSRAFSNYSLQQSYLNNSSIFNISSSVLMNQNNKINKEKNLYKIVSNNIIKNYNKKENKKDNDSLFYYHQYRDITEVDLPSKYNEQSLINNILLESNINDKIIFNYNKLNDLNTSIIIYDGIIYKVIDKKNIGFKLSKRYFQLTKNCFRYYYEIEFAKNNNEPLVQFDIRHIKDLQIISHDFLNNIKINEKDIEFVFCIFLFQNDDFFVFAFNNENYGNSVFNILNLLKNYYEDKK